MRRLTCWEKISKEAWIISAYRRVLYLPYITLCEAAKFLQKEKKNTNYLGIEHQEKKSDQATQSKVHRAEGIATHQIYHDRAGKESHPAAAW
jgi:hypothetical protein